MADFPWIPGYAIVSVLGEGGMAKVYLGIQEKLNRNVAIKVLNPLFLKNKVTATRFEKEAKTAAGLSHSNIIQIFDTGKSDDYHYIVMEYLEESLTNWMRRQSQGRMDPGLALDIVEKLMAALDYAHFRGIYHRDIKPDNIMFRQDSTPVLVDFGIARLYMSPDDLTKSGIFMGTSEYMSPEQCKSRKEVDGRSDIYSLGVVLFEMLTGERPYKAESQVSMALQHIEEPVPGLPEELRRYQPLIDKMMAKDKKERLSSGAEFLRLLDKIIFSPSNSTAQPIETSQAPSEERPSSKPMEIVLPQTGTTMVSTFKKLISLSKALFNKFPVQKKVKTTAIRILSKVVWVGLFLIIFIQGPKTSRPSLGLAADSIFINYNNNLRRIYYLYNKGDLESLKKGLALIDSMKKINPTPQPILLEERFNNRIDQLEQEFNKYLADTRNYFREMDFSKAKESILKAKQIKVTRGLEMFEQRIDVASGDQLYSGRSEEEKKKDDNAYEFAISKNTIEAYRKYLLEFPEGRHKRSVSVRLNGLKEFAQEHLEGKLRSIPIRMNKNDVVEMLKRYNFFDNTLNESGAFKGRHENVVVNGGEVVLDHITGLMWYNGRPVEAINIEDTEKWLEKLNSDKYAGYDDWRFPTLEEAASLLQKNTNPKGLHMIPHFLGQQAKIWTADISKKEMEWIEKEMWIVCFDSGNVETSTKDSKHHVLPVRSVK